MSKNKKQLRIFLITSVCTAVILSAIVFNSDIFKDFKKFQSAKEKNKNSYDKMFNEINSLKMEVHKIHSQMNDSTTKWENKLITEEQRKNYNEMYTKSNLLKLKIYKLHSQMNDSLIKWKQNQK